MTATDELITVWISKYAMSKGLYSVRVRAGDVADNMVREGYGYHHGEGKEWHRDYASALARAERMHGERIESLRRSLGKMERLRFPQQEPSE